MFNYLLKIILYCERLASGDWNLSGLSDGGVIKICFLFFNMHMLTLSRNFNTSIIKIIHILVHKSIKPSNYY